MEFIYCYSSSKASNARTSKLVRWEKPPSGWTKLNTDGAALGNPGVAGCGGIVWDERGNWVAGFARKIRIASSFKAELWGLRDGLTLCCNLNISSLIVELDAKVVVDILHNVNYENNVLSPILDDCRQLMSRFDQVQVNHVYRQANGYANGLAKMGAEQESSFLCFPCPPEDIRSRIEFDGSSLYSIRLGANLKVVG